MRRHCVALTSSPLSSSLRRGRLERETHQVAPRSALLVALAFLASSVHFEKFTHIQANSKLLSVYTLRSLAGWNLHDIVIFGSLRNRTLCERLFSVDTFRLHY